MKTQPPHASQKYEQKYGVGSCRVGMAWKTAKSRKWEENWTTKWKTAPNWRGSKNGPKQGFLRKLSIFLHFQPLLPLSSVQLGPVFYLVFQYFPISGFWPFSMPCQPAMIPKYGRPLSIFPWFFFSETRVTQ